jgi:flagellar biogenesis protein FliO
MKSHEHPHEHSNGHSHSEHQEHTSHSPFTPGLLMSSSAHRVLGALCLILFLRLAVAWAVMD